MSSFLGARDFGFLPSGCGGGGGGGLTSVSTLNTPTFSFYGDGTCFNPLCGCPIISSCAGNSLTVCSDGLFSSGGVDNAVIILGAGTCSSVRKLVNNSTIGNYSGNLSGCCNSVLGNFANVVGGGCNTISSGSESSFIGSGCCNLISSGARASFIGGGESNTLSGGYGFSGSGKCNTTSGCYSISVGGLGNISSGCYSYIGNGRNNTSSGIYAVVVGGFCNLALGLNSAILGGCRNCIVSGVAGNSSVIVGGFRNCNSCSGNFIGAGSDNVTSCIDGVVVGGLCNFVTDSNGFVGGGSCNRSCICRGIVVGGFRNCSVTGCYSAIVNGCNNTSSGQYGFVGNGKFNISQANFGFIGNGICNNVCNSTSGCLALGSVIVGGVGNNTTGGTWDLANCCFSVAPTVCNTGQYTFIGGGFQNRAENNFAVVVGGCCNVSIGRCAFIANGFCNIASDILSYANGRGNSSTATQSFVGNGFINISSGVNSFIGGGVCNTSSACYSFTAMGCKNLNTQPFAFIGNGFCNCSNGCFSFLGSGFCNSIISDCSFIGTGTFNLAQGIDSFIGSGDYNTVCNSTSGCLALGSVVVGGVGNNTTGGTWNLATCGFTINPTRCNTGQYTFIGGGFQNRAAGEASAIVGGQCNIVGCWSVVGGGCCNTAQGSQGNTFVGGGWCNCTNQGYAGIVAGYCNLVTGGLGSIIGGGIRNTIFCPTDYSGIIGGGADNKICCSQYSVISGGDGNCVFGGGGAGAGRNTIAGGTCNCIINILGSNSFIGGGFRNTITGRYSVINGGSTNSSSGLYNVVSGGRANNASGTDNVVIGGGGGNTASGCNSSILGGAVNIASGCFTNITGGFSNVASGNFSSALGGCLNTSSGLFSFIGSGFKVRNAATYGTAVNGQFNSVCADSNGGSLVGGIGNIIDACNVCCSYPSFIGGGAMNYIGCSRLFKARCVAGAGNDCLYLFGNQTALIGGGQNVLFYNNFDNLSYCVAVCSSTFSGGYTQLITTAAGGFGTSGTPTGGCIGYARNLTTSLPYALNNIILGGFGNTNSGGGNVIISGNCNNATGGGGFIGNGANNNSVSSSSTILNGNQNTSSEYHSTVISGIANTASGRFTFIGAGIANVSSSNYAFTGGGYTNFNQSCYGVIVGGESNRNWSGSIFGFIGGGSYNTLNACCQSPSYLGGGRMNYIGGAPNTVFRAYCTANSNCLYLYGNQTACFSGVNELFYYNDIDKRAYSAVSCSSTYSGGYTEVVLQSGSLGTMGLSGGYARNTTLGVSPTSSCGVTLGGGFVNTISTSAYGVLLGGFCNTVKSNYSGILGGKCNDTSTFCDTFIIGSCLTASQACTTFVNCLSAANIPSGCAVCSTSNNVLIGYTPSIGSLVSYGSFYDTTTQTEVAGTPKAMEFNNTVVADTSGFSITNNALSRPTRITAAKAGLYNLQFSAQLNRTTGGSAQQIDIWFRKNGTDESYSNTAITMQANNGKIVAAWNYFIRLTVGQYVEIMWVQSDSIEILAQPAGVNFPETPSVIATITQIA